MTELPVKPVPAAATVTLTDPTAALTADVLIIGTVSTGAGVALAAGADVVDQALGGALQTALREAEASGRRDEIVKIPTLGLMATGLVIASGMGDVDPDSPHPEVVRRAVGAALRSVNSARRVAILITSGSDPAVLAAISDGALLGSYRFTRYKSTAKPPTLRRVDIATGGTAGPAGRAAVRRSKIVMEAVNQTRTLINLAPNELNPPSFAQYARSRGEQAGLSVEVLDERGLKRGRFGGILAVGSGSATPPRLVRLHYQPPKPRASVALIGKGITFDTGGLDLKTAMMAQMKSDMSGAAAVIEAIIAAAALKLPVSVTATVPMAENSVSGTSYRPSDVLTMRNGKTVEVDNTDAEGRIVLADAIARACEDQPDYLIETSTLTGGQMVALGTHTTGAMGSEDFRDRVVAAGAQAGESLWPMPLPAHLHSGLDSAVADLQNLPKDRWASMLMGGMFLAEFVSPGVQWVHLDIAGPSFATAASGYNPKGGTGVIVRTIVATLESIAAG